MSTPPRSAAAATNVMSVRGGQVCGDEGGRSGRFEPAAPALLCRAPCDHECTPRRAPSWRVRFLACSGDDGDLVGEVGFHAPRSPRCAGAHRSARLTASPPSPGRRCWLPLDFAHRTTPERASGPTTIFPLNSMSPHPRQPTPRRAGQYTTVQRVTARDHPTARRARRPIPWSACRAITSELVPPVWPRVSSQWIRVGVAGRAGVVHQIARDRPCGGRPAARPALRSSKDGDPWCAGADRRRNPGLAGGLVSFTYWMAADVGCSYVVHQCLLHGRLGPRRCRPR